jgi:WD40 repeat protein
MEWNGMAWVDGWMDG